MFELNMDCGNVEKIPLLVKQLRGFFKKLLFDEDEALTTFSNSIISFEIYTIALHSSQVFDSFRARSTKIISEMIGSACGALSLPFSNLRLNFQVVLLPSPSSFLEFAPRRSAFSQ